MIISLDILLKINMRQLDLCQLCFTLLVVIALDACENRSRISQAKSANSGNTGSSRRNVQKYQNEKNVCFFSKFLISCKICYCASYYNTHPFRGSEFLWLNLHNSCRR